MWFIGWIVIIMFIILVALGIYILFSKKKETDDRKQKARIREYQEKQSEEMFKQRKYWNNLFKIIIIKVHCFDSRIL